MVNEKENLDLLLENIKDFDAQIRSVIKLYDSKFISKATEFSFAISPTMDVVLPIAENPTEYRIEHNRQNEYIYGHALCDPKDNIAKLYRYELGEFLPLSEAQYQDFKTKFAYHLQKQALAI